jgi:hypothetical protein
VLSPQAKLIRAQSVNSATLRISSAVGVGIACGTIVVVALLPERSVQALGYVPVKALLVALGFVFAVWAGSLVYAINSVRTPLLILAKLAWGLCWVTLSAASIYVTGARFPREIKVVRDGVIIPIYADPISFGVVMKIAVLMFVAVFAYSIAFPFRKYLD